MITRYERVGLRGGGEGHEIVVIGILSHLRACYWILDKDRHGDQLCDELIHLGGVEVAVEPFAQQHVGELLEQQGRGHQLPLAAKERVNELACGPMRGQQGGDEDARINDCAGHLPPLGPHRVQLVVRQRETFRFGKVTAALHPADDALQPRKTVEVAAYRVLNDGGFRAT